MPDLTLHGNTLAFKKKILAYPEKKNYNYSNIACTILSSSIKKLYNSWSFKMLRF